MNKGRIEIGNMLKGIEYSTSYYNVPKSPDTVEIRIRIIGTRCFMTLPPLQGQCPHWHFMTFFPATSPIKEYSRRAGSEIFIGTELEFGEDGVDALRSIQMLAMEISDKIVEVPDIRFWFPRTFFPRISEPFN